MEHKKMRKKNVETTNWCSCWLGNLFSKSSYGVNLFKPNTSPEGLIPIPNSMNKSGSMIMIRQPEIKAIWIILR